MMFATSSVMSATSLSQQSSVKTFQACCSQGPQLSLLTNVHHLAGQIRQRRKRNEKNSSGQEKKENCKWKSQGQPPKQQLEHQLFGISCESRRAQGRRRLPLHGRGRKAPRAFPFLALHLFSVNHHRGRHSWTRMFQCNRKRNAEASPAWTLLLSEMALPKEI